MNRKCTYVTPETGVLEFNMKTVLCTSERNGEIDQLTDKYDWSDMWNN